MPQGGTEPTARDYLDLVEWVEIFLFCLVASCIIAWGMVRGIGELVA